MRQGLRRRHLVRVVMGLFAVVLLAACRVDTTVGLTVNPDGTGTVTVTVTADAAVVAAEPKLAEHLQLEDFTTSGWTVEGPTGTPDGGLSVVLKRDFVNIAEGNAVLAQVSGPFGPLKGTAIEVSGTPGAVAWTFTGQLDLFKGLDTFGDQPLLATAGATPWAARLAEAGVAPADAASVTFSASLPGTLVDEDGKALSPGTPNWTAHPGDAPIAMSARTNATSLEVAEAKRVKSRFLTWLTLYGLVVAALVGLWFYLRARRNAPPPRSRTTAD